jgi:hypothetical protein
VLRWIGGQVRACSLVRPVTSREQHTTWLGTPRVHDGLEIRAPEDPSSTPSQEPQRTSRYPFPTPSPTVLRLPIQDSSACQYRPQRREAIRWSLLASSVRRSTGASAQAALAGAGRSRACRPYERLRQACGRTSARCPLRYRAKPLAEFGVGVGGIHHGYRFSTTRRISASPNLATLREVTEHRCLRFCGISIQWSEPKFWSR